MNRIKKITWLISGKLIIVLLLIGIAGSQYYGDIKKKERPIIPPTIIPDQAVRIADLGLHSAVASAMWVYTIQQVVDNTAKLPELIENVNSIDPKFSYPYAFAALVLPSFKIPGFREKTIEIAERGIREADPDWRIPYYLATTYHIFFKNREKAAYYFDLAARTPGATDKIKSISRLYGTAPDIREQTRQIWLAIYESTGDELVREQAHNHLVQIELLNLLDRAVLLYKQRYQKYPSDVEELVSGKILKKVPVSPLGTTFYIEDGKAIAR